MVRLTTHRGDRVGLFMVHVGCLWAMRWRMSLFQFCSVLLGPPVMSMSQPVQAVEAVLLQLSYSRIVSSPQATPRNTSWRYGSPTVFLQLHILVQTSVKSSRQLHLYDLIQILDNKSCVPHMFICPNTQHFSLPHKPIQLEFHLFKILKSFLQFSELVSNRM